MALDVIDTIKSSFKDLNNHAGKRVLLTMVGLGLLYTVALASFAMGTAGMVIGTILLIAYVAAAFSFAVGSFRSMAESEFRKEHYTDNIGWPAFRLLVSGLVNSNLAVMAGYAIAGLGLMAAIFTSAASGMMVGLGARMAMLSAMSSPLMQVAMLVAVAVGLYVATSMILSLPLVAVEDRRLFEALDHAVSRSKGSRARMFATVVPAIVLFGIGYWAVVSGAVGAMLGSALFLVLSLVAGAYHISLLAQLTERL